MSLFTGEGYIPGGGGAYIRNSLSVGEHGGVHGVLYLGRRASNYIRLFTRNMKIKKDLVQKILQ